MIFLFVERELTWRLRGEAVLWPNVKKEENKCKDSTVAMRYNVQVVFTLENKKKQTTFYAI